MKLYVKKLDKKWYVGMVLAIFLMLLYCGQIFAAEAINPTVIKPGANTANIEEKVFTFKSYEAFFTVPINVGKDRNVYCEINISGNTDKIIAQLNSTSDNTFSLTDMGAYIEFKNKMNFKITPNKGLTQYLHIAKCDNDFEAEYTIKIKLYTYEFTKSGTSLSAGKWLTGYQENKNLYYKIKLPYSGIINIQYSGENQADITLVNTKKKDISSDYSVNKNDKFSISAKAGSYYLKIKPTGSFKIRYITKKVNNYKNTTINKAISLKKGKTYTDILTVNSSNNSKKWYKFTIPKTQKVKIIVQNLGGKKTSSSDSVEVNLGKKGGYVLGTCRINPGEKGSVRSVDDWALIINSNASIKLKKGTYYIRVNKSELKQSLYYTIKLA